MSSSPRPASLARRALPALLLTGASAAFLSVLDHPTPIGEADAGADTLSGQALATDGSGAPVTPSTTATTLAPQPTPTTPNPSPTPTPAPTTVPSTVPPAPTCTGARADGQLVNTRFGPVQVAAVVSADGRLCDVAAVTSPSGDRRSASISAQAVPMLDERALAAQGADFQGVSGATYTSQGYKVSLQSILDGQ